MIRILTFPFRLVLWVLVLPFRIVGFVLKVALKALWLVPKTLLRVIFFFPKTLFRSMRALGATGLLALAAGMGIGFLLGSRRSATTSG